MDRTKSPGISIECINLINCCVGSVDYNADLNYRLGIKKLARNESKDGLNLTVIVDFDLMDGVEEPPCVFNCAFIASYVRTADSNMSWPEFTDVMTVMHMIPYVREFVSSVSLRLPIKELMLPPTNVNALVAEYHKRQQPASITKKAVKKVASKKPVKAAARTKAKKKSS